jgi:hypothetical protein
VDHSECYFIFDGIIMYVMLHTIEHLFQTFGLWMLYFTISCGPIAGLDKILRHNQFAVLRASLHVVAKQMMLVYFLLKFTGM